MNRVGINLSISFLSIVLLALAINLYAQSSGGIGAGGGGGTGSGGGMSSWEITAIPWEGTHTITSANLQNGGYSTSTHTIVWENGEIVGGGILPGPASNLTGNDLTIQSRVKMTHRVKVKWVGSGESPKTVGVRLKASASTMISKGEPWGTVGNIVHEPKDGNARTTPKYSTSNMIVNGSNHFCGKMDDGYNRVVQLDIEDGEAVSYYTFEADAAVTGTYNTCRASTGLVASLDGRKATITLANGEQPYTKDFENASNVPGIYARYSTREGIPLSINENGLAGARESEFFLPERKRIVPTQSSVYSDTARYVLGRNGTTQKEYESAGVVSLEPLTYDKSTVTYDIRVFGFPLEQLEPGNNTLIWDSDCGYTSLNGTQYSVGYEPDRVILKSNGDFKTHIEGDVNDNVTCTLVVKEDPGNPESEETEFVSERDIMLLKRSDYATKIDQYAEDGRPEEQKILDVTVLDDTLLDSDGYVKARHYGMRYSVQDPIVNVIISGIAKGAGIFGNLEPTGIGSFVMNLIEWGSDEAIKETISSGSGDASKADLVDYDEYLAHLQDPLHTRHGNTIQIIYPDSEDDWMTDLEDLNNPYPRTDAGRYQCVVDNLEQFSWQIQVRPRFYNEVFTKELYDSEGYTLTKAQCALKGNLEVRPFMIYKLKLAGFGEN